MKAARFVLSPLLASLTISGCVSSRLTRGTHQFSEQAAKTAGQLSRALLERTDDSHRLRERQAFVGHPYLVGKSTALSPDARLPLALQANVKTALMFPGKRVSLAVAAEQITLATKIPVVIAPDVYLPAGALLPRSQPLDEASSALAPAFPSAAPVSADQIAAGPLPPLPTEANRGLVAAGYAGMPSIDTPQDVDIQREEMQLAQTLDLIGSRLNVNWKYDAKKGVIRLYRMVTKTWSLPIKPSTMSYSSVFPNGASQSNHPNALTTGNDQPGNKTEAQNISEMTSILNDIQTVMTRAGSVSGNLAAGTLTLTDTKDAVDRAETIVNFERALLSKLVAFHVRLIQVTRHHAGQLGVDWQLLLTKALRKVPGFILTATSPATLIKNEAASIGMQLTSGQFSGTQAVVDALAEIGTVASTDDIPLQVQNRHSLYYDNVVQFSYVSNTMSATATTGGTGGVPGITTSQDQVGLRFLIYPTVTDNNTIALTVSLGNSVLNSIQPFTSGRGSHQQTVQLVNKSRQFASTDALVRNGGMVVLTAYDHRDAQYDKRTLGEDIPLAAGGSLQAARARTTTLFLLSASVRDMGAGQSQDFRTAALPRRADADRPSVRQGGSTPPAQQCDSPKRVSP